MDFIKLSRELTRSERRDIRRLVVDMCANYDSEYGCLPLDSSCYMLGKCYTGSFCKYFKNAILPLNPVLEANLMNEDVSFNEKTCPICGSLFIPLANKSYCSEICSSKGRLESYKKYNKNRKKRQAKPTAI